MISVSSPAHVSYHQISRQFKYQDRILEARDLYFLGDEEMKTYQVHFIWNGKPYQELISSTNGFKARDLIRGRYPGAKITLVQEV